MFTAHANGERSKYLLHVGIVVGHFIDAHIYSWRIHAIKYACVYFQDEEWKSVWGLIDIFLRPAKNPSRPPGDPLFKTCCIHTHMHACTYTHTHTHKAFIALNCASVWSASISIVLLYVIIRLASWQPFNQKHWPPGLSQNPSPRGWLLPW